LRRKRQLRRRAHRDVERIAGHTCQPPLRCHPALSTFNSLPLKSATPATAASSTPVQHSTWPGAREIGTTSAISRLSSESQASRRAVPLAGPIADAVKVGIPFVSVYLQFALIVPLSIAALVGLKLLLGELLLNTTSMAETASCLPLEPPRYK
jgi:hypothetical protein